MTAALPGLTALLTYRLDGPAADFTEAARRLAARVEAEGEPGLTGYRFWVGETAARAVADYRDADGWLGHHATAMGWPEMADLRRAATLTEIVFLGPVDKRVLDWLAASGLGAEIRQGNDFAAGFARR